MSLMSNVFGFKKKPINRIINRDPNNQRNFNGLRLENRTGLAGSRLTINSQPNQAPTAGLRIKSRLDLK